MLRKNIHKIVPIKKGNNLFLLLIVTCLLFCHGCKNLKKNKSNTLNIESLSVTAPKYLYFWINGFKLNTIAMDTEEYLLQNSQTQALLQLDSIRIEAGHRLSTTSLGYMDGRSVISAWTNPITAMMVNETEDNTKDLTGKSAILLKLELQDNVHACHLNTGSSLDAVKYITENCELVLHKIYDNGNNSELVYQDWSILNSKSIKSIIVEPQILTSELEKYKDLISKDPKFHFNNQECLAPKNCLFSNNEQLKRIIIPKIDKYFKLTNNEIPTIIQNNKKFQMSSPWKNLVGKKDFHFSISTDEIDLILKNYNNKDSILQECLNSQEYKNSLSILENTIAKVSLNYKSINNKSNDSNSELFVKKFSGRLWEIIKADAKFNLLQENQDISETSLQKKIDEILVNNFGKCASTEFGCVGNNVETIKDVFHKGNTRERLYILYRSSYAYLGNNIFINSEKFKFIYAEINNKNLDWKLSPELLNKINPFVYGTYARETHRKYLRKKRPTPLLKTLPFEQLIPFSDREIQNSNTLKYNLGESIYEPSTNNYLISKGISSSEYLTAAEQLKLPLIAGISGTTDQLITMATYLNFSEQELLDARLAFLGWMISVKAHSAYEVLTSTKSFSANNFQSFNPSPDYYKQIYPEPEFVKQLEIEQMKNLSVLPEEALRTCVLK